MRSSLIQLESSSLNMLYIAPIDCIVMNSRSGVCTVRLWGVCPDRIQLLPDLVEHTPGSRLVKNTDWLSLLRLCPPGISPLLIMECISKAVPDVVDLLGKVIRYQCIALQKCINNIISWMFLNCLEVQELIGRMRIQAIFKHFLLSSSWCQWIHPSFDCPLQSTNNFFV